jgi:hypothetical protein
MSETLSLILQGVVDRLHLQVTSYLPSLIAAAIVIFGALVFATVARRILYHIFKGAAIDWFMRRTGLAHLVDPSGRLRATRMTAEAAYWSILTLGVLAGLSVFGTDLTAQLIQSFVFLIPRLVIAGLIILAGAWLSHYLARCALVWAFNENLPYPRRLAVGVRTTVFFVAIVVASDHLNFARDVFLTAFIILVGGFVLAVSLAVGIGASSRIKGYLSDKEKPIEHREAERSLWHHL